MKKDIIILMVLIATAIIQMLKFQIVGLKTGQEALNTPLDG